MRTRHRLTSTPTALLSFLVLLLSAQISLADCCFMVFDQDPTTATVIQFTIGGQNHTVAVDPAVETSDDAVADKALGVFAAGGLAVTKVGDTAILIRSRRCSAAGQSPPSGTSVDFSQVPDLADVMVLDNEAADVEAAAGETGAAGGGAAITLSFAAPIGDVVTATVAGETDFATRNNMVTSLFNAGIPLGRFRTVGPTGLVITDGSMMTAASTDAIRNIGVDVCPSDIPALGPLGFAALVFLLGSAAVLLLLRRLNSWAHIPS